MRFGHAFTASLISTSPNAAADGSSVEITCVGCPRYRVVVTAADYKEAEDIMKTVSNTAIESLTSNDGTAVLKRESK